MQEEDIEQVLSEEDNWSKMHGHDMWLRSDTSKEHYRCYTVNGNVIVELVHDHLLKGTLENMTLNLNPDKSLIEVLFTTSALESFKNYIQESDYLNR